MAEPLESDGLSGPWLGYTQQPTLDMDLLNRVMANYSALPPPEPIRLTQEQWEKAQALLGRPVSGPAPLGSVPVHIVERVEDSTPYLRWLKKLRAAVNSAFGQSSSSSQHQHLPTHSSQKSQKSELPVVQ